MQSASRLENEAERLEALLQYQILDTDSEPEYDQLVELAATICKTPISLVSLIDKNRQWFKAAHGLGARETARELAFCDHAIHGEHPFIVSNALEDPRFADNPLVIDGPEIRFYAGVPLKNKDGFPLGTLCVIDQSPRELNADQIRALEILANQTVQLMEQRLYFLQQKSAMQELERQHNILNKIHHFNLRMLRLLGDEFEDPVTDLSALLKQVSEQEQIPESLKQTSQEHLIQLSGMHQSLDYLVHWQELQTKTSPKTTQPVNLNQSLATVIQRQEALATQTNKQTNKKVLFATQEADLLIQADRQGLLFVLNELLHNSLKFSSAGSTIQIELSKGHDHVNLRITDTGPGFGLQQLQALQNNLPLDPSMDSFKQQGLGLGWLISQRYLNDYSAQIEVKNRFVGGAEVQLKFVRQVDKETKSG